jgi:hypothetical protein
MAKQIFLEVCQMAFTALLPAVIGLLGYLIIKVTQHFHLQITKAQAQVIETTLYKAISYAEEVKAAKAKCGVTVDGKTQLALAIQFATQQLGQTPNNVAAQIEAILPTTGISGASSARSSASNTILPK